MFKNIKESEEHVGGMEGGNNEYTAIGRNNAQMILIYGTKAVVANFEHDRMFQPTIDPITLSVLVPT